MCHVILENINVKPEYEDMRMSLRSHLSNPCVLLKLSLFLPVTLFFLQGQR